MATITLNCATAGVGQVHTVKSRAVSDTMVAEVLVTPAGTYDQAASESIEITNIATLIAASRRNGKTATLTGAMPGQGTYGTTGTQYRWLTASLNSTTVDATIYDYGTSAELADGAIPTLVQPMSVLVSFVES